MPRALPKYPSSLLIAAGIVFLAGCATGPAHYQDSGETLASVHSLQSTVPEVQVARFGAYALAADKSFVGTMPDGRVLACAYRWAVPGVVLEEKCRQPWATHMAFQYNPSNGKLDVFNLEANRRHIRELTVLPDASVEWPTALLGLEPASRVTFNDGSLDRVVQGSDRRMALSEVTPDQFESVVAGERARREFAEESKARARVEFLNSVTSGLRGVSSQLRAENEAKRLRDEQMRAAMIRAKAAEMQATNKGLAEQQRRAKVESQRQRESESTAQEQAASRVSDQRSVGTITVDDDIERHRKFQQEEAERKRQADAQDAAMRKRKAQLQAESDAAAAARRAEAEKRIAALEARDRARLSACAARGIPKGSCPSSASRQ